MKYEDEIYRRPKKTWFQSGTEKKQSKKRAADAHLGPAAEEENKDEEEEDLEEGEEHLTVEEILKRAEDGAVRSAKYTKYAGLSRKQRRKAEFKDSLKKDPEQRAAIEKSLKMGRLIARKEKKTRQLRKIGLYHGPQPLNAAQKKRKAPRGDGRKMGLFEEQKPKRRKRDDLPAKKPKAKKAQGKKFKSKSKHDRRRRR